MRLTFLLWVTVLAIAGLAGAKEEHLATLAVGSDVYTNVTVTSVTVTHVFFTHSQGMASAKLADLEPAMQQHFQYDPAKAAAKLAEQAQGNALYIRAASKAPAVAQPRVIGDAPEAPVTANDASPHRAATRIASNPPTTADKGSPHPLYAKALLNQPAPELFVETWLTEEPDRQGKFVLVDFWATWCGPCRRSIPHLNELHAKYKDRLVIIGLSKEPEQAIRKMTQPKIEYTIASDTQGRTAKAVEVRGIPHLLLIDPKGIVRFQGMPQQLSETELESLMAKYAL